MRNPVVTIFGGSGFIGRRIVARAAARHAAVRVVTRDPDHAGHLRPLGEVGQVSLVRLPNDDPDTISKLLIGSTHAVNLVGVLFESRKGDFDRYHHQFAKNVAEGAKSQGVQHLAHLSAIGASDRSPAQYGKSKAAGEKAVLSAFPEASILRPSIVIGEGDGFFSRFADMARFLPVLPLIAGGGTKFQPVSVDDVADAVDKCLFENIGQGETFELGGPKVYSFKELLAYMLSVTGQRRWLMNLPIGVAKFQASIFEKLPQPPLTTDQIAMLGTDNVVAKDARTLADLGIDATPIEVVVPRYLRAFGGARRRLPLEQVQE